MPWGSDGRSWSVEDGGLRVETEVLRGFDQRGRIAALVNASAVWLDIGINFAPTPFPRFKDFRRAGAGFFFLGFEPLLDKYAHNVAQGLVNSKRESSVSLGSVLLPGSRLREAGMMVPMAVANRQNRPATLHVSRIDGCSSLNEQRPQEQLLGTWGDKSWIAKGCGNTLERRTVPTVTLAVILSEWLGGREVEFLHIDVQGNELDVVRSGGDHLRLVQRMMLEVPSPHCTSLTAGAATCEELFAALDSRGFTAEDQTSVWPRHLQRRVATRLDRGFRCADVPAFRRSTSANFTGWCEADVMFVRKDLRGHWSSAR